MEELPAVRWTTHLSPSMDRREQLRRYAEATSHDQAKRQVRLHRETLPKPKR